MWRRKKRKKDSRKDYSSKTCEECRRYSRKTFYCSKWLKVLDIKKSACMFFRPRRRHRSRSQRARARVK